MKIISHLRRQVHKRANRKMEHEINESLKRSFHVMEKSKRNDAHHGNAEIIPTKEPTPDTIFASYSETGEKFLNGQMERSLPDKYPILSRSSLKSSRSSKMNESTTSTYFPSITQKKTSPHDLTEQVDIAQNGQNILITEVVNNKKPYSEADVLTLRTKGETHQNSKPFVKKSPDDKKKLHTDQLNIVTVPKLLEKNSHPSSMVIKQVLDGHVLVDCPAVGTIHYLYIAAGSTDMEAELSFMQEHLYPKLRSHFRYRGLELRIIDLHWGFRDTVSDDHKTSDIIRQAIAKAQQTNSEFNFVIFLGQKYGSNILPSKIPQNVCESILNAASSYRQREEAIIRAALEKLRAQELEKEMAINATMSSGEDMNKQQENPNGDPRTKVPDKKDAHIITDTADKDGSHSAPLFISDHQAYKALREAEDQLPDVQTFRQWYVLDTNEDPPVYKLQNISTVYKDITRNDANKRQVAKQSFASISSRMINILQTFAEHCEQSTEVVQNITRSMLEKEIDQILQNPDAADHTLCIVRTIEQLTERLDEPSVGDYIDLSSENDQSVDISRWSKIESLRNGLVNGKVPERNIISFLVEWANGGIRPGRNRSQYVYLERMCKTLFDQIVGGALIKCSETGTSSWTDSLFSEMVQHVKQCHERVSGFLGQEDVMNFIETYLKSDTRHPLVVYGKSGCGKSSILAKTAIEIKHWFQGNQAIPRVLYRMIGSTSNSLNVRTMLQDILLQLAYIFGNDPKQGFTDYKGVMNNLCCRLEQATEDKPIVIILDGVDRLFDDYEGRRLSWLPLELPLHVHLIISTRSEEKMLCLPAARVLLKDHANAFLEIGQIGPKHALTIVNNITGHTKRFTKKQFHTITDAFQTCSNPIYVQMAIAEALRWTSYQPPDANRLEETVERIVVLRVGKLEIDHGEPLARRALGYISASRYGIGRNELEDILSLDDAVMDDIMATYKLPRRHLPTLLLIRLLDDINDLIIECCTDSTTTIKWAYLQISDAIEERYLTQRDKAPSYHKALAAYFLGTNTGKTKNQINSDKSADRFTMSQELYHEPETSLGDGSDRIYNQRALTELPYHLMKCQMSSQLKQYCLCNYEWMLARLCGTSLQSLLEEYHSGIIMEPADVELKVMLDVLLLSREALQVHPRQLAAQLVGRLQNIVAADDPKAPGDPKKYPHFYSLLSAAKQSSIYVLIPSVECLTKPGALQFDLLSGHTETISAVTLMSDGMRALTTSSDKTIKLWDIRTGKVIKSINGLSSKVFDVKTAMKNTLAITVEGAIIKIWDIKTSQCLHTISQYVDPANIAVADDDKVLVAVYHGSNIFRSWNLDNMALLSETRITDKSVHKDNSILIGAAPSGTNAILAFRSGNTASIYSVRNGKLIKKLLCHEKNSAVVSLAVSSDYFIICCRQQHVALNEINSLELFDAVKGVYIRTVLGCPHDNIEQITINLSGSHAIAVSSNSRTNTSDIAVFNLETEEHKHLAYHKGVSTMCVCLDFRYCLTGTEGDNSLKVWNLSSSIIQTVRKVKKQLGLCDIWPMIDNPRYVLAKAVNNGPISVWNVTKGKCLQSAVRIERGLTEGYDALIVRNTRLVILTDRALSNVSIEPFLVFQTVLVYELKLKKYIRKLQGCYIVPAASHEYSLLDNDNLLGPSENRSHFIIWNLVSGNAVARIKTAFKEFEKTLENSIQFPDGARLRKEREAALINVLWEKRIVTKQNSHNNKQDKSIKITTRRLELLREEKHNLVDQFLVSENQQVLIVSFYAHHLCVFDIQSHKHTHTLQAEYSMMFLHTSALTFDGGHLVHANYDEVNKNSYVTLWDCTTGEIKRRLKKEKDVIAIAITDDAQRVVIGLASSELHIWDPMKSKSLRRIRGYNGFHFGMKSQIFLAENGEKAIVFAGDISVWDLATKTLQAVFTPDARISVCKVILNGKLIIYGLYDKPDIVVLKLSSGKMKQIEDTGGAELFGETTGDTSDEDENEDEDQEE